MKRHLCIWLRSLPNPSGRKAQVDDGGLESIAREIQQQICPFVGLEPADRSLLCDITGVAHLFAGEAGLLTAVDRLLTSQKISGQLAIADSVGAAWAVAHYATEQPSTKSPSPSPACDRVGPFPQRGEVRRKDVPEKMEHQLQIVPPGLHIVPPGGNRQALEPLPVEALRIEAEIAATLSRLGIHFISQLLQLPRSGLAPRLGKPLVHRIEQALGEVDEPIAVYHPPAKHIASHRLEYSTSDQNILADRIRRLVQEVRAGLAICQRGALRMTCRLDLSAHPPLTLEIGLFAPTIDADHLLGLIVNRIENVKLPAPVELLTLAVPLTGPLRSTQASLFNKRPSETNLSSQKFSTHEISRLVDSLSGRLGCDSVVGVNMEDNPLPEKAFSVAALAGNGGSENSRSPIRLRQRNLSSKNLFATSNSPSPADAMRRPLSLLSRPIPIAVANESGSFCFTVDSPDPPQRIRIGDNVHAIVRYWGTERIETSWWNGPSIRRDYYRVETDSGRWLWIFRNLAGHTDDYCWMLHGRFN